MGSQQSYGHDPTTHFKRLESLEQYEIYECQSGEDYEKYQVFHDGSEDFQKNYQFRVENRHNNLVDVVFAGPKHGFIGCTDRGKYEVITERIPQRLASMKSIDSKHALVILKTALRGFRDLYRKHGIFGIKDSMIGTNRRNKVKVWINHNFAVNRAEETPGSYLQLTVKDQQREMVQNIIDLVDLRADHGQLWREMIHLKEMRNPCTFDEALNLVDYFCGANQLNLTDQAKERGSKRQTKLEAAMQPTGINRNLSEERSFKVNGRVPVHHFPFTGPLSRESNLNHNNITFQGQHRPVQINNSQLVNHNLLPLRAPSAHFAFTVLKHQPTQAPAAQFGRYEVNSISQQPTNLPSLHNTDAITQKYEPIKKAVENTAKCSETRREPQAEICVNTAPTLSSTENPTKNSYSFNKVNQQAGQPASEIHLKQPQFQVHINEIASQQSSSQHSPSVLQSNELDRHQLNYPEHKIVFQLERISLPTDQVHLQQSPPTMKETAILQFHTQGQEYKKIEPAAQQSSISYKEMRRLLMEELQQ